jgi:hypothetical protein
MAEHKNRTFEIIVSNFLRFKEERNQFLQSTVTGDKTWVFYFTPEQNIAEFSENTRFLQQAES